MRFAALLLLLPLPVFADCQITAYTPALMNGWQNYGSGMKEVSVWKDCMGVVHLAGGLKGGGLEVAFVLPDGFRPSGHEVFPAGTTSYDEPANIYVTADGKVTLVGDSTYFSVSGVAFRAAPPVPSGFLGSSRPF